MKTREELNTLKQECEELDAKLQGLSDDELNEVIGGSGIVEGFKKIGNGIRGEYPSPKIIGGNGREEDQQILGTYKKDIGSDKNAKIIFGDTD